MKHDGWGRGKGKEKGRKSSIELGSVIKGDRGLVNDRII